MLYDDPALTVESPHVAELRRQMVLLAESAPLSPEHTAASDLLHAALDERRAEVAAELHRRLMPLLEARDSKLREAQALQEQIDAFGRVIERELCRRVGGHSLPLPELLAYGPLLPLANAWTRVLTRDRFERAAKFRRQVKPVEIA
jgi:hypothetical protein